MVEYIKKRIQELNSADVEFCKDRWNKDLSGIVRSLARENSNQATFARQELERVLKHGNKTLEQLEAERMEWSLKTFPEATKHSSIAKLKVEIREVQEIINRGPEELLAEEYADCLMCLFDSVGRAGIDINKLTEAFRMKLEKNKARVWVKNADNTYSHVKQQTA